VLSGIGRCINPAQCRGKACYSQKAQLDYRLCLHGSLWNLVCPSQHFVAMQHSKPNSAVARTVARFRWAVAWSIWTARSFLDVAPGNGSVGHCKCLAANRTALADIRVAFAHEHSSFRLGAVVDHSNAEDAGIRKIDGPEHPLDF
jgi:hypothetical protein